MQALYKKILEIKENGKNGVLITVVNKEGHCPAPLTAKMLILANGDTIGTVGGGEIEYAAIKEAHEIFKEKKGLLKTYLLGPDKKVIGCEQTKMICDGKTSLFFEYIGAAKKVYIFGAGHIGEALVYHLKNLDYFVTLIDNREKFLKNNPNIQKSIFTKYDNCLKNENIPDGGYYIIATHSHELDYIVLKRIYEKNCNPHYIGLIASHSKVEIMKKNLMEELGKSINLNILYSPAGLNIGGKSPNEIAISVISELQAIHYGKLSNNHLRDK